MSYHLTILKTKNGERTPLQEKEVENAIAENSKLRITSKSLNSLDFEYQKNDGASFGLSYRNGEILTRYPDDSEVMDALLSLAEKLGARLRGDEFETYRNASETFYHPDDRKEINAGNRESQQIVIKTKKRQWMLNIALLVLVVLLGWLANYLSH